MIHKRKLRYVTVSLLLFAAACTAALPTVQTDEPAGDGSGASAGQSGEVAPNPAEEMDPTSTDTQVVEQAAEATPTASPEPKPTKIPTPTRETISIPWEIPEDILLPEEDPPRQAASQFSTDFSKHSISYVEILSGGPPKDGIPAVDQPQYVSIEDADQWLRPVEPVLAVEVGEAARAYPLQILTWHEIVNDTLGELPLAVTFCPLCNTGIAFDRTVLDHVLDFGTTGRLRYSNLIMYDRQTESWWQQATGQAIAGDLTGFQLDFYPTAMISWEQFKTLYPNGDVLSRDTGNSRPYGRNPYLGYDDINNSPFLYFGPSTPEALLPMTRVLTLDFEDEAVAYPYGILEEAGAINDTVSGQPVAVFWSPGTASALDADIIAAGRNVGSAVAFSSVLDGQTLTFVIQDGVVTDEQTGSVWNLSGQAESGTLIGKSLTPLPAINHFWFSWAAFKPDTRIYQVGG